MRRDSKTHSYTIVVAPVDDKRNTYDMNLYHHIGNDYSDIVDDILEEFADETLTAEDIVIVDYDCPNFIDSDFRSMLNETLNDAEADISYVLDLLDTANENSGYYDFDDLVFLAMNSEDPDNIIVYGGEAEWSDYMDEILETYHVKYTDFIYKAIDFDKLRELMSVDLGEYELPSGKTAWIQ